MTFRIFLLLFGVFWTVLANAVPVKDLYKAEINLPIVGSEEQMLNDAFSLAVEQVLIRVSGNKAAISGDLLEKAKKMAPTWVAQHSVTNLNELLPYNNDLVPGKQIKVTFYQESVNRFLTENRLPIWGSNRPSVLVWLVTEENGVRSLSGANSPSAALNGLAKSTAMIGVPIYAPLVDDVDKQAISPADVWGFFEDNIDTASQRYQTDAVAALKISDYAGILGGDLLVLQKNGGSQRFSLSGDKLQELLDQAAADLALVFSSHYAAVRNEGSENRLQLQVSGIESYAALHKVQSYLESVGVVRDVYVVQAKDNTVMFMVLIDGNKQKLMNSISLSRLLIKTTNQPGADDEPNISAEPVESFRFGGVKP